MKNNVSLNVKKSKPFKVFDLIIYSSVILLTVLLFCVFVLFKPSGKSLGFTVNVDNKKAFTYYYEGNKFEFENWFADKTEKTSESSDYIEIKVYTNDDKDEYNLLFIDKARKSVKVIDANCSNSKDCTLFSPVKGNNGTIICLPHSLKITPLSGGYVSPILGG